MAGERVLSDENLSTIAAVTFVLALVSLTFNFFLFSRQNELAMLAAGLDRTLNEVNIEERDLLLQRIQALEAQQQKLEDQQRQPAPTPAPG